MSSPIYLPNIRKKMTTRSQKINNLVHKWKQSVKEHEKAYNRNHGNQEKISKYLTRATKARKAITVRMHNLKRNLKEKMASHGRHVEMAMNSRTQNNYHIHVNQAGKNAQNIYNIKMKLKALKKA